MSFHCVGFPGFMGSVPLFGGFKGKAKGTSTNLGGVTQ